MDFDKKIFFNVLLAVLLALVVNELFLSDQVAKMKEKMGFDSEN